jgi:hypothetical protein
MNWAWGIPGLNPTERLTLLALADYADNEGYCFPGQDVLMERVGVSRRTIVSTLQSLEDRGFFRRERRTLERGRRTSDGYQLGQRADSARATDDRPNVQTVAHTYKEEPSGEPSVPPIAPHGGHEPIQGLEAPPEPEEDHFSLFWAAYPRKVGKPQALRAWKKALKGGTHWSIIVGGAAAYAEDPNREDAFTKHPGPWLNAEAWNDGPLPERPAAPGAPALLPPVGTRTMSERVIDCTDVGRQHRRLPDGSCMLCESRDAG